MVSWRRLHQGNPKRTELWRKADTVTSVLEENYFGSALELPDAVTGRLAKQQSLQHWERVSRHG